MDMKQYDKAIDDLNQAIRFNPESGRLFNKRGWAWYCREDFDKAISDLTQAIGLDPQLEDALRRPGHGSLCEAGVRQGDRRLHSCLET